MHKLMTFEHLSKLWSTQLAGLLTGKALAAYASLNGNTASSYDDVKKATLHHYDVNEEAHRRRFRSDRKKPEESYQNWGDRLSNHFTRWTKDRRMPLEEVMVLDQFLAGAPEELRVWLKERKPESLKQATELADDYTLARGGSRTTHRQPPTTGRPGPATGGRAQDSRVSSQSSSRAPLMDRHSQTNAQGDQKCFHCGGYGHIMYNCPKRGKPTTSGTSKALLASDCDEVAWNAESQKYLRRGTLDGRPVQMLIDTGCNQTVVSARLVAGAKTHFQRKVPILCAHGDTVLYPTAKVKLQMKEWTGEGQVAVAPHLPVDVLLGMDIYGPPDCQ